MFAIKAKVSDPKAKAFAFSGQKNEAKRQRKLEPAEAPAVGTGPSPVSENTISGSDATGEKS